MLAFAVSLALIYQVPYGFTDRTAEGKKGLGKLAGKIALPSRATVKLIATEGDAHAAAWSFTLPELEPIAPSFADELAGGIAEMGKKAPAIDLQVKQKQLLQVQGTDGGRVDVDMTIDGKRMRERIFYAPGDGIVSVLVYLCPLDELARYTPIFDAAAQGREAPNIWERPWPWTRIAQVAAVIAFLVAGWGARRARQRLIRSAAGSAPSRSG